MLALTSTGALAAGPDLVCEVRYASEEQLIRQRVSDDPYASTAQSVGQRFQFKAVVLGQPERIEHVSITVYDLSVDGAPVVIHQVHYEPPFNMHAELPALTRKVLDEKLTEIARKAQGNVGWNFINIVADHRALR